MVIWSTYMTYNNVIKGGEILFIVPMSSLPALSMQQQQTKTQQQDSNIPFADVLSDAMKNAAETRKMSQEDSYKLAVGEADDLAAVMIGASKATIAMEFAVELTSRAVGAYNEIIRMQI